VKRSGGEERERGGAHALLSAPICEPGEESQRRFEGTKDTWVSYLVEWPGGVGEDELGWTGLVLGEIAPK
jgi:hypothetical protein